MHYLPTPITTPIALSEHCAMHAVSCVGLAVPYILVTMVSLYCFVLFFWGGLLSCSQLVIDCYYYIY